MQRFVILLFITVLTTAPAYAEHTEKDKQALKPIKMMLNYALRKKDEKAIKYVGLDEMTKFLMGDHYQKATPEQRGRFKHLLGENIKLRGFPMVVKYFKSVDVPLDKPVMSGDTAKVRSTIIWSGSERTKFDWVLTRTGGKYGVTDIINEQGESSMGKNKERVQKIISEKGIDGLLDQFEKQVQKAKGE